MPSSISLTSDQILLVEKFSLICESSGLTPASSKILALLFVSDQTELTFDQIRETLTLSKSATSNAINLLISIGKIEYATKIGDRKRYFRAIVIDWAIQMKRNLKSINQITDLLEVILNQRPKDTQLFNDKLAEVIEFMTYLGEEIPKIYERWEAERINTQTTQDSL